MADGAGIGGWSGPTVLVDGQEVPLINIKPSSSQGTPGYNGGGNASGSDTDIAGKVTAAANQHGVDPDFALKIAHAESGLNPDAISSAGAHGVMQLMPGTAKDLGVDRHNVDQNIDGGVRYLKQLSDKYGGNKSLIAAAYNAGPGAVDQHGGVPPYPETQAYVNKVVGNQGRPTGDTDWSKGEVVNETPSVGTSIAPVREQAGADWDKGILINSGVPADNAAPAQVSQSPGYQKAFAQANQNPNALATGLANAFNPETAFSQNQPEVKPFNSALNGYLVHALPVIQGGANAIGQALNNLINKNSGVSAKEAYQAGRDASQQDLSSYSKRHPILNAATDLGGQIATSAAIPELKGAGLAARLMAGAAKIGGQSALTGAGGAASEGQSDGEIAKSAAVNGALGMAFSPIGELGEAGAALSKSAGGKAAARLLLPSAAGATIAGGSTYQLTHNPVDAAKAAVIGSAFGGAPGLAKSKAAQKVLSQLMPDAEDKLSALMHLTKAIGFDTPEAAAAHLESKSGQSVIEAVNKEHQQSLMQVSGELNPNNLQHAQQVIETRQNPLAVKERLKSASDVTTGGGNALDNLKNGIEASGLPHPDTAQMDYVEHLENQHNAVARPEWAKIAEDEPLHTEQHQKLLGEPEVREAMSRARHNLGPAAETANPNYVPPENLKTTENLTAEDYKAVNKDRVSFDEKGNSVFNPDIPEIKQGNSKAIADYLNKKNGVDINSGEPETVPTAKAWIEAQKHLESEVARNDFTGKVEPDSKSSVGNWRRSQLSRELNELNKGTIGNLTEAKAASGDVISGRENAIKGANLGNKAGQSWQEHRVNFEKLDEGDKAAQRFGYSKQMSRDFSRINPETGDQLDTFINKYSNEDHTEIQKTLLGEDKANKLQQSLYNTKLARAIDKIKIEKGNVESSDLDGLKSLITSESEQRLQNKLYGPEKAEQIREAIRQEISLAKHGKEITSFEPKAQKEHQPLGTALSGAFGAMSQIGAGPVGMLKGGATGAALAKNYQIVEHAMHLAKQGNMTPGARQYLGETLAKPTEQVAEELKMAAAQKRNMKASQSQIAKRVGHAAAAVTANAVGPPIKHALSNVNTN